jgi:hypothetical protein
MQSFRSWALVPLFLSCAALAPAVTAATVETEFNPASFPLTATVPFTNEFLPFDGGTLVFQAVTEDECEISRQIIGYMGDTVDGYSIPTVVNGVGVLVVRDQEWLAEAEDGDCDYSTAELQEDTFDYYAEQDRDNEAGDGTRGTVWYLGEHTFSLPDPEEDEGPACSTAGTWEAGVGDAEGGILMLANPQPGDRYQQEYDEDNAEDWGAVLRLNRTVSLEEIGELSDCLVTREWSPLEPGGVEKKTYCRADGDFPGGLALVEELTGGKTLRVEYIGSVLPEPLASSAGASEAFPAFTAMGCSDPN